MGLVGEREDVCCSEIEVPGREALHVGRVKHSELLLLPAQIAPINNPLAA